MGQPELFAKKTFADETARITGGAVIWQDPPEIRLESVRADGLLVVQRSEHLAGLAAPWPAAQRKEEVLVEVKMPGDHLDMKAVERTLLRRQARQVQRVEERAPVWPGDEQLWMVAAHVPQWIQDVRMLRCFAPGCYLVEPMGYCFVWLAANELPLREELIPFLVTRSGRPMMEFLRWVLSQRPPKWVMTMVKSLSMSETAKADWMDEILDTSDPKLEALERRLLQTLLRAQPAFKQELIAEAVVESRLAEARSAIRRVLVRRRFVLRPEEDARIDACSDLAMLERWLDQAVTAGSVGEALE